MKKGQANDAYVNATVAVAVRVSRGKRKKILEAGKYDGVWLWLLGGWYC